MTMPPTPQAAWAAARADGIGVEVADRLYALEPVQISWLPPVPILHRASAGVTACMADGRTFTYRLALYPDGWWVEGQDGGPWVQCEGPIVDSGRPPYLARPKVLL